MLRVLAFWPSTCANAWASSRVLAGIGSADAELQRPADRRPELERRDARHQRCRSRCANAVLEPRGDRVADLVALGHDHGLREVVVGELRRRAAGRSGSRPGRRRSSSARCRDRPSGCFSTRSTASCVAFSEALCGSVRSTSSSGRSDFGKNCCCTSCMPTSDSTNSAGGRGQHQLGMAQRQIEHAVEPVREARRAVLAVAVELVGQDEHAGQRREQHGDDPRDDRARCRRRRTARSSTRRRRSGRSRPARSRRSSPACRSASGTRSRCRRRSRP